MLIMLVGKIDVKDWRHMLVRDLAEVQEKIDPSQGWPVLENAIHGIHSYVGPYFKNLSQQEKAEGKVAKTHRLCLEAVDKADLIYAWVDDLTCYASLFELGYAHAKGKYTVVCYPPDFDRAELWFTSCCSDLVIEAAAPQLGLLKAVLSAVRAGRIVSPAAELSRVEGNLARLSVMGLAGAPPTMETPHESDGGSTSPEKAPTSS